MNRVGPIVFSVVMLGAVMSPLVWSAGADSFPVSSYPMFSHGRSSSEASITHVVAIAENGARTIVPPGEVASSAVMQTLITIQESVHAGPASTKRFCRDIARRLADSSRVELRNAVSVEIETARIDAVRYLGGDTAPIERTLHARCKRP